MSFLLENNSENIAARITHKGRQKIAQGNFNISYFQIGDSEFDYGFSEFDGDVNRAQKVLMPMDKDNQVKYPYKVSESTLTGTTYGTPIQSSYTQTVKNQMNPAGFVSQYIAINESTIESLYDAIDISELDGTSSIDIPSGDLLTGLSVDDFITIPLSALGAGTVTGKTTSFVYRITGITSNTLELDRSTPDLSSLTPRAIPVIKNGYYPLSESHCDQLDSWTLNVVWSQNPAGLDPSSASVDEKLSGYTSNVFVSTKEYFGYNTSSGQITNTGTTITNSLGDVITVSPEEQHSLAILRYPRDVDIYNVHNLGFKYEDYLDSTTDGSSYFEIFIPYILYDRVSTSHAGAEFFMGTDDYYINSSATDTRNNQMVYRRLLDQDSNVVGKIFVNQKLIVFDDQEIIAALDYKSNRRHTLPIPRISSVPVDSKCDVLGNVGSPLLESGYTVYVTYLLTYDLPTSALTGGTSSGFTGLTGLHCNYYSKITGGTNEADVSITFGDDAFQFMVTGLTNTMNGYVADKFYILAQKRLTGQPLDPTNWYLMDYTSELDVSSGFINPQDLRGTRFIISNYDFTTADPPQYVLPDPDPTDTSTSPEFGDEQPFPGSVSVIRATDLEVMNYFINLPSGYFEVSQNPTEPLRGSYPLRITEVALLDSNKEVLVMAKTSSPIPRVGSQVVAVKIDI